MQERFFLLNLVKRFGGDDGLHLRAIGGERFGQLVKVDAKLLADLGVDSGCAVVKGLDGGRCGVRAIEENRGDHVCGFHAEVCIIHAVAEERAVQGEGVSAGVVGDAGLCEGFVDRELGLHDGVVGRGEDSLHAVGNERLRGQRDFVYACAGAFDDLHALVLQVSLCAFDGARGGVLTEVIQKADLLELGVLDKHEVHDGCGVEVVGGAGKVAARGFEGVNQTNGNGVGNGGEDDGGAGLFGGRLHGHGDGRCDRDEKVRIVSLEVRDDLGHEVRVCVAVVVFDVECHAFFFADGGEAGLDVFNDLVEGRIVHIIADADGVGCSVGRSFRRSGGSGFSGCGIGSGGLGFGGRGSLRFCAAGGEEGNGHQSGQNDREKLFHGLYQPFNYQSKNHFELCETNLISRRERHRLV